MPSGPLAHICLLVKDLDQAIEDSTKILEILDPAQLKERLVRYDEFEGGEDRMRWATFVNPGSSEIQLMEPDPDSPLGRRLKKRGEPVHHICFTDRQPGGDVQASRRRRSEHPRARSRTARPDDALAALDLGPARQRPTGAGRGPQAVSWRSTASGSPRAAAERA